MRRVLLQLSLFAAVSILMSGVSAAQPVFVGIWQLDTARSTYTPGPMPRRQTAAYSVANDVLTVVADRVEADGRTVHFEWSARFDGTDYTVSGDPSRDSVAVERVDDHTLRFTNKKNSRVTTRHDVVFASDGRSRVETIAGVNAQGQTVHNVTVWIKQ